LAKLIIKIFIYVINNLIRKCCAKRRLLLPETNQIEELKSRKWLLLLELRHPEELQDRLD